MYSRAETMQNIESTIVELGGIFQQLAHMVKEQEEMVERYKITFSKLNVNFCNFKNTFTCLGFIIFSELIPMFKMLN